jgi:ADP-ribose pyrophosphatase YjhB (NUDIX family)
MIRLTTSRVFCRFARGSENTLGLREIPSDGFCISTFLVIADSTNPKSVLMGKIDPSGPWDHLGAMFPELVQAASKGWMLPSSHLIALESPDDSARRILREQLGAENLQLSEPKIFSEVYNQRGRENHWDLQLVFQGKLDPDAHLETAGIWKELRFLDIETISRGEIARLNGDILAHLGLRTRD